MSTTIRNNVMSQRAAGQLADTQRSMSRNLQRVASGSRIARTADDAAGSAVSVNLSAQASSTRQGIRNANDGLAMIHTAEEVTNGLVDRLQRMRELAVQSATGTLGDGDRNLLQKEFQKHINDIKNTATRTTYNGQSITLGEKFKVQVGANDTDNDRITIQMPAHNTVYVGVRSQSITTADRAKDAMKALDGELDRVNKFRGSMGADTNRLMSAINAATEHVTALESANSRIEDADYALETAQMSALQIKNQAGTAAIAQANGLTRGVIGLIA